ncbi:MAG: hypothetical protein P1S46_06465 [bacterium]|nr:hypothetical protein [bacterium]
MKRALFMVVVVAAVAFHVPAGAEVVTGTDLLMPPVECGAYGSVCDSVDCVPDLTSCIECHVPDSARRDLGIAAMS